MSRCLLGPKKLRKVQALLPPGMTAVKAMVRGGNPHGCATVDAVDCDGNRVQGFVNYLTGDGWKSTEPVMSNLTHRYSELVDSPTFTIPTDPSEYQHWRATGELP